ncbi:MAG: glycosyhydrolase, partial [Bacteroidales bacterium]|nr:glycosyhydrolase [Bacteroidales bacterium]
MKKVLALLLLFYAVTMAHGQIIRNSSFVSTEQGTEYFTLCEPGYQAPVYMDTNDYPGVIRAAKDLITDIGRVTGTEPALKTGHLPSEGKVVIAGTMGKNTIIDKLIKKKKIDRSALAGKRETFIITLVEKPIRGIDRALVIAGSDKRGTIYGLYEVSAQIGVSPWYWWADVPVKKKSNIYIKPGVYSPGEPAVRYRGIFINDEAPALSG